MITRALTVSGLALFLSGTSALAHHSHYMYDTEQEVSLQGIVKEFKWTNPHVWIHVVVTDDNGHDVEWALEGSTPSGLARNGWRPKSITPGEQITVTFYPLKNGEAGGNWKAATLADGTVL